EDRTEGSVPGEVRSQPCRPTSHNLASRTVIIPRAHQGTRRMKNSRLTLGSTTFVVRFTLPLPSKLFVNTVVHWFSGSVTFVEPSNVNGALLLPLVALKCSVAPEMLMLLICGVDGAAVGVMLTSTVPKPALSTRVTMYPAGVVPSVNEA